MSCREKKNQSLGSDSKWDMRGLQGNELQLWKFEGNNFLPLKGGGTETRKLKFSFKKKKEKKKKKVKIIWFDFSFINLEKFFEFLHFVHMAC